MTEMLPKMSDTAKVFRYQAGETCETLDEIALEEPLEIRVRGRALSVTMRTPGHDDELTAGFLMSEGIIRSTADVLKIEGCDRNDSGNVINVQLAPLIAVDFEKLTRHVFASSSCGLCGKATIDALHALFPHCESDVEVDAATILSLPEKMRRAQQIFSRTGGLHAAALFNTAGDLLILREDIGRHNAVDKVLGHALLNRFSSLDRTVLLVSGRTSFEILQKALSARIPILAAVSAPSSLAVQFAEENGQTLIGFLRGDRMNIYSHPQRVRFERVSDPA